MALLNITKLAKKDVKQLEFLTSNNNITVDTLEIEISRELITEQEWLGNF